MLKPFRRVGLDMLLMFFACVFAAGKMVTAEQEPSWPQFHGPDRDNVSSETGLLKQWPAGGPKLLWTADGLGDGYSSASVANGTIFTAGDHGEHTTITAMDMQGKILWQTRNGKAWNGSYPGSRGTPTVELGRVYHESPHGDVTCLDAKTGKQIWTVNILKQFGAKNIRWALSESLLIDGERVVCCPGGPNASVVALNKKTGEIVWKCPSTGDLAGYASPILAECQGMRIIITLTSRAMIGVNADTGQLLWRVKHVSYADENVLMPIYHDGHVSISTLKAGSVKWQIAIQNGKASVKEVWRSKAMDNHHGGVVLIDGYLYGSSCMYNKSQWICMDWATGEKQYAVKGVGTGALTCAGGLLYTLSRGGRMGIVRPTPTGHKVISSFKIPAGGKGPSWAHPVVCGGRLYIRHAGFLYVYDVQEHD